MKQAQAQTKATHKSELPHLGTRRGLGGGVAERTQTMSNHTRLRVGSQLLQPKLAIGKPNDAYEQEADRVAEQVMRMSDSDVLQRKCASCDEEEKQGTLVQRKATGDVTGAEAPPIVHEVLRSPGQPLDSSTRAFMEPRFGRDFSDVRVHTDAKAAESARAVGALAYTVGRDVVTLLDVGTQVVAHELAHVVQQSSRLGTSMICRRQTPKTKQPKGDNHSEFDKILQDAVNKFRGNKDFTIRSHADHGSNGLLLGGDTTVSSGTISVHGQGTTIILNYNKGVWSYEETFERTLELPGGHFTGSGLPSGFSPQAGKQTVTPAKNEQGFLDHLLSIANTALTTNLAVLRHPISYTSALLNTQAQLAYGVLMAPMSERKEKFLTPALLLTEHVLGISKPQYYFVEGDLITYEAQTFPEVEYFRGQIRNLPIAGGKFARSSSVAHSLTDIAPDTYINEVLPQDASSVNQLHAVLGSYMVKDSILSLEKGVATVRFTVIDTMRASSTTHLMPVNHRYTGSAKSDTKTGFFTTSGINISWVEKIPIPVKGSANDSFNKPFKNREYPIQPDHTRTVTKSPVQKWGMDNAPFEKPKQAIKQASSRKLTSSEIAYAHEIFSDSLDYSLIEITRDSIWSIGAPKTIGNTIHMRSDSDWGHFVGDSLELTEEGKYTLIHEMTHVWQYQNGGIAYIPESLINQLWGWVKSGSRNAAYDWREAAKSKLPWAKWNPEQQASLVEDYNKALRNIQEEHLNGSDYETFSLTFPYVQKVWSKQGAPSFSDSGSKGYGTPGVRSPDGSYLDDNGRMHLGPGPKY